MTDEPTSPRASVQPDILVVDDTPANLDLLTAMLGDRGYRVRVATNGPRALQAARASAPDLVMLDINMPGMHGYDVCRQLRADPVTAHVPVIFVSALDEVVDKVKAFDAGGVDYVTKPFQFGEVLARIENQLRLQRMQRDLENRNAALLRMNEELREANRREDRILHTLSDVLPGTVLDGKYLLETKLGSGGFGTVYRAVQINLQRPVAVKIFHRLTGRARDEDLDRFRGEGISACRVNHPNAVGVIDTGVSPHDIAYLVMELLQGRTLADEMDSGLMKVERVAEVVLPVCDVLATAHAIGVVHRDIKPENIFLHRFAGVEVVKVLDFGLAKLLDTPVTLTLPGTIVGTPLYMAPERLAGQPHDPTADVYAVGLMVYEMLTARLPWDGEEWDMASLTTTRQNHDPIPLRELDSRIPEALEDVVMAAIDRDPARRPRAEELGQAIARWRP